MHGCSAVRRTGSVISISRGTEGKIDFLCAIFPGILTVHSTEPIAGMVWSAHCSCCHDSRCGLNVGRSVYAALHSKTPPPAWATVLCSSFQRFRRFHQTSWLPSETTNATADFDLSNSHDSDGAEVKSRYHLDYHEFVELSLAIKFTSQPNCFLEVFIIA